MPGVAGMLNPVVLLQFHLRRGSVPRQLVLDRVYKLGSCLGRILNAQPFLLHIFFLQRCQLC